MKITSPYFLALMAIVLYSVSMLVYATLSIFKGANVADIAAFGSVLGGIGSFFGGFIALFIFYGWKQQYNKTLEKEIAWEVIQNFIRVDNSFAKVQEKFYFFKLKIEKINELNEDEANGLDDELRKTILELSTVNFELGTYLEALRKYSVVAENSYYNDFEGKVLELKTKIFTLLKSPISMPSSVETFEDSLKEIIQLFIDLENKNINILLKELKAIN